MNYTVYKITNKTNGKIYVGVHQTTNLDDGYYGSGLLITRAINKHGVEHFDKEITHFCDSPEEMFSVEAEIVNEDFVAREDTYNLKVGGFGGWDYVNSMPEKFSAVRRLNARMHVPELQRRWRAKYDSSKEFREVIRNNSKMGLDKIRKMYGDSSPFKGKTHSDDSKRKIGEANSKHQKGKGNSQYGTCWVYSLEEKCSKKIDAKQLDQYLEEGWSKGRKMKF